MSDLTPREEESYAKAASELYEGKREEFVWAKAFVEAEGDEDKARTIYIKLRTGQLTERAAKKAPAKKAPAKRKGAKKKHYDKCPQCRSPKWLNAIQQCQSCGYELVGGKTRGERERELLAGQTIKTTAPPRAKSSSHGAGDETESKNDGCCLPVIVIVGLVALFAFTDFFGEDENSGGKGDSEDQQDAEEQLDPSYHIPRHTPFPTIKGFRLGMTKNELIENLQAIGEATVRGWRDGGGDGKYEIRQRGEHQITFDLWINPSLGTEGISENLITVEYIDRWGVNKVIFTQAGLKNRVLFNVQGDMSMRQFFDGLTKKHGLPSGRYWSGYVKAQPAEIFNGIVIIPAEEAYMARESITLTQKLGPRSWNYLRVYTDYGILEMESYREDFPKEKLKPKPPGSADFD